MNFKLEINYESTRSGEERWIARIGKCVFGHPTEARGNSPQNAFFNLQSKLENWFHQTAVDVLAELGKEYKAAGLAPTPEVAPSKSDQEQESRIDQWVHFLKQYGFKLLDVTAINNGAMYKLAGGSNPELMVTITTEVDIPSQYERGMIYCDKPNGCSYYKYSAVQLNAACDFVDFLAQVKIHFPDVEFHKK